MWSGVIRGNARTFRTSTFRTPPSRCRYATQYPSCEPLRILFCGSDDFSNVSLKALHAESKQDKSCIASLDVVCRPPKPTGRGLKTLREGTVPIAGTARYLGLPLHEIDTFRGWKPPNPGGHPINLIIAVSFGLLVPSRILEAAEYGGLNVHPSLLPDFRGPAPLHHTLLQRRTRTGVTVQTLHPKYFDRGSIVAQTPWPGFEHRCQTVPELAQVTASEGAALLLHCVRSGSFLSVGACPSSEDTPASRTAPKIKPEDRRIEWSVWSADEIMLRQKVIGPLWNILVGSDGISNTKRLIWSSGFEYSEFKEPPDVRTGQLFSSAQDDGTESTFVKTRDDKVLKVRQVTFEGQKAGSPIHGGKRAGFFDTRHAIDWVLNENTRQSASLWSGVLQ